MLATLEMKKLLDDETTSEVQKVYTSNLPKEEQENIDETIILITDVNADLGLTGNNSFFSKTTQIEIQIFYKQDLDFDIEAFENRLLKVLKQNHWSINDIRGHTTDPDTLQVTAVFYVSKENLIN